MSYKINSILIILLILSISSYSQHGKKKDNPQMWFIGGGMIGGETPTNSFYGPNVEYGFKRTIIRMGKYMNFSLDVFASTHFDFIESGYEGTSYAMGQTGQISFNFNALAGAYRQDKKASWGIPVGAYLGPGLLLITTPPRVATTGTGTVTRSGDLGPYVNFGLRGKVSKFYFIDLKVFGGFTVFEENAVGGVSLRFPIGIGSGKKKGPGGGRRR